MADSRLQRVVSQFNASATNHSVALTANTTVGNTVVLAVRTGAAIAVNSVSDSQGNVWTVDASAGASSGRIYVCSGQIAIALLTTDTITVHLSGATAANFAGYEYVGLLSSGRVDKTAAANGSSTAPATSATGTTAQADELVVAAYGANAAQLTATIAGAFTIWDSGRTNDSSSSLQFADQFAETAATFSSTWTLGTTGNWAAVVVTYRADVTPPQASRYLPLTRGPAAAPAHFFAMHPVPVNPAAVAAGGPSLLTVTASDASVSTESLVMSPMAFARTISDTSASSGTATRVAALPRAASDSSVSTETASRSAQLLARTAADPSSSTETPVRVLALPRTAADSSVSTETAARVLALPRSASDTSNSTETATRAAILFARSASDASSSTETPVRVLTQARTAGDSSGSTESAVSSTGKARTIADLSVSTEALTRAAQLLARAASDLSVSTESVAPAGSRARTASDASLSTETSTGATGKARSASDTSASSESAARGLALVRQASDQSATSEAASRVLMASRGLSDQSTSTAGLTRTLAMVRAASDSSASSTSAPVADPTASTRTASDASGSSDVVTRLVGFARTASSTSASSERLVLPIRVSIADVSLSSDALSVTISQRVVGPVSWTVDLHAVATATVSLDRVGSVTVTLAAAATGDASLEPAATAKAGLQAEATATVLLSPAAGA